LQCKAREREDAVGAGIERAREHDSAIGLNQHGRGAITACVRSHRAVIAKGGVQRARRGESGEREIGLVAFGDLSGGDDTNCGHIIVRGRIGRSYPLDNRADGDDLAIGLPATALAG